MSNYLKKLIVEPGSKIRLKHFDPGYLVSMSRISQRCPRLRRTGRKCRNCST